MLEKNLKGIEDKEELAKRKIDIDGLSKSMEDSTSLRELIKDEYGV